MVVDGEAGPIVAVARYIRDDARPRVADFAIVVIDECQGDGVGHALMLALARRAR